MFTERHHGLGPYARAMQRIYIPRDTTDEQGERDFIVKELENLRELASEDTLIDVQVERCLAATRE